MAIYKRGETFHTDVTVNGRRFRQSLHTTDWREAQKRQKDLIRDADELAARASKTAFAKLPFADAANEYIEDRAHRLRPNTVRTERERLRAINKVLGTVRVSQITVRDVSGYIRKRAASVSNATVNRELDIIRGVLKKAKLWALFTDDIKTLEVEHHVGRALDDDQKLRLLRMAESRPEWEAAFCAAVIALNTTMRGVELKHLRWADVDMNQQLVRLRKSKTEAGKRTIPLTGPAMYAMHLLWDRSKKIEAVRPDQYIFFSCEHGRIDPAHPQKSWRSAWRSLTRAIDCPSCTQVQAPGKKCIRPECGEPIESLVSPLAGLRFHDLRHSAITELAESQASDQVIMEIAGHVSQEMLKHYSHIRIKRRREAVETLAKSTPSLKGYVTNHVTNESEPAERASENNAELMETNDFNLVELVGIEPTTSSLRTMRSPS
jgi:integrase